MALHGTQAGEKFMGAFTSHLSSASPAAANALSSVEGYGVIDAEQVRELASAASLLIADPLTSPADALRYQPSAALERAVRCRDLTCRFPGCNRPAAVCDIDRPFRSTTRIRQPAD